MLLEPRHLSLRVCILRIEALKEHQCNSSAALVAPTLADVSKKIVGLATNSGGIESRRASRRSATAFERTSAVQLATREFLRNNVATSLMTRIEQTSSFFAARAFIHFPPGFEPRSERNTKQHFHANNRAVLRGQIQPPIQTPFADLYLCVDVDRHLCGIARELPRNLAVVFEP